MYRLRTFGGASIEDAGVPLAGAISQRRRLAVLALLAAAPSGAMSRERLAAFLFPEADAPHAHHALSDALHAIRKALGRDSILASGDELRLNASVVTSDLSEFEAALQRADCQAAAAMYCGPFLDGFFVPDAPELERWAAAERDRIARRYATALECVADERQQSGDWAGAVVWWRMLAAHDPYSSRIALRLMRALSAAGESAQAIQHANVYGALVSGDLGAVPDPEVTELARALREAATTDNGVTDAPVALRTRELEPALNGAPSTPPPAEVVEALRVKSPRWRSRALVLVTAAAALLGGVLVAPRQATVRSAEATRADSVTRVAVLPFLVRGGPELSYLRDGMATLLGTSLDGVGALRTVEPNALLSLARREPRDPADAHWARSIAAQLGADQFITGEVVSAAGRLYLRAVLYPLHGEPRPVARASVEGESGDLFRLVDRLAAELLVGREGAPASRLARVASVTTASLPALKAYLDGEQALREARYELAFDAFARAADHDSTFALAHYRLGMTAPWLSEDAIGVRALEAAVRHSARLSHRDRLLLSAGLAERRGAAAEAEAMYRWLLQVDSTHVEARLQLGEVLYHYGPLRGRPIGEARAAFERVIAVDPNNASVVWHLARIAAEEDRWGDFDSLISRYLAIDGVGSTALQARAVRAFARGSAADQAAIVAELSTGADGVIHTTAWRTALNTDHLSGAGQLAGHLTAPSRPMRTRVAGHKIRAVLALAAGRWSATQAELQLIEPLDSVAAMEYGSLLALTPVAHVSRHELRQLRERIGRWNPPDGSVISESAPGWASVHDSVHHEIRTYLLGRLDARLGDLGSAEARARELGRRGGSLAIDLAWGVRAEVAAAGGRSGNALAALERVSGEDPSGPIAWSPFFGRSHERFARAELLHAVGRSVEAAGWFDSMAEDNFFDLPYLGLAYLRQAEIHERGGRLEQAAAHYSKVGELWKDADGEWRRVAGVARAKALAMMQSNPR